MRVRRLATRPRKLGTESGGLCAQTNAYSPSGLGGQYQSWTQNALYLYRFLSTKKPSSRRRLPRSTTILFNCSGDTPVRNLGIQTIHHLRRHRRILLNQKPLPLNHFSRLPIKRLLIITRLFNQVILYTFSITRN